VSRLLTSISDAPINVALCVGLAQGGITQYSYSLAEALQAVGVRTTNLLYRSPAYDLEGFPHAHRVSRGLDLATSNVRRFTSPVRNLVSILGAASRNQLVHFEWSLGERSDRLHWPLIRRLGRPIIYTAHDVLPHEQEIMSDSHCRYLYQTADALIVHGEALKSLLCDRFGVDAGKVRVMPHGNLNFMADSSSRWNRESARTSFGFDEDDRVVLFFGLIREYKGIDVLIEACRRIQERGLRDGQKLRLLIAGRSFRNHWQEANYETMIRDAGLSDSVRIELGHVEMADIPRLFHAADVLVAPYKRGSQSGVLRLAYSFGKASVATRVGSLAEVPRPGIAEFVEPGDAGELADALGGLLSDPEAAERMGANARAYADEDLDWAAIARSTRALYESLL
jgi:glycosyltransferase involved in cell wall biosynthesis